MDQTCPVVHKSRRPQARLKTVTLFDIHCGPNLTNMALIYMTLYQFSNDTTTSCNRPIPVHLNDMATTNDT
jgi:hypothetical protein